MNQPQRHTVRFAGYDYTLQGAYFVTVCADKHRPFFGHIENDQMRLNWVGTFVEREWLRVAELRPNIALNEYVVMPNHFHAIILITSPPPVGTQISASGHSASDLTNTQTTEQQTQKSASLRGAGATPNNVARGSLSAIVRDFKANVTRTVNAQRATRYQSPVKVWQGRFHDRIIRDEKELLDTRRYIIENPQNWQRDEYA